jgi:hypothetical protein
MALVVTPARTTLAWGRVPSASASASTTRARGAQSTYRQFRLWESHEISETLIKWKTEYPDFIRVHTAQDIFGLPRAGNEDDCPHDEGGPGCLNYWFTLQDYAAHPEGSYSSNRLPEVMWSGELHGDERVGPTAVLEASQLLMDAALCESLPRVSVRDGNNEKAWESEVQTAQSCRDRLESVNGITSGQRQWLARLLTTRRIVVVPTANALGYYRVVREEGSVDPNRDFPYDLTNPRHCMQTVAARTLNEIFRLHMFQLSFTFHGGMEVIGYEWGAPTYQDAISPDDAAQHDIAQAYSRFGGGWSGSKPYAFGDMNSQVYPVRGGFEDWAYAGSWDPERVITCQPSTFGGYGDDKTSYGPGTLRAFNMLVESSDNKIPPENALGTSQDLLKHDSAGTGYVSRNIRLSLLSAELVEPYVAITEVNELVLADDLVPTVDRSERSCQKTKTVSVPANSRKVVVQWSVGGALTVDSTQIWYGKWSDVPMDKLDCLSQPEMKDVESLLQSGTSIGSAQGTGRFHPGDVSQSPFSASLEISKFSVGDQLVVLASARVDQNWLTTTPRERVRPAVAPQSHVVNSRTNASWRFENDDGKVVWGRLDWFSAPLTIVLREDDDKSGDPLAIELSWRYTNVTSASVATSNSSSEQPADITEEVGRGVGMIIVLAVAVVATLAFGGSYLRHRMRYAQRSRVREFIDEEEAVSPGLREVKQENNGHVNGYTDMPEYREVEMT